MTYPENLKPKFTFSVDGTHDGWQLAQFSPDAVRAVRNLDADESHRLNGAVYTLRDHIKGQPTRMLASAEASLVQAIEVLPVPGDGPDGGPEMIDLIVLPMVSWLLMWRLQRENLTADVRTKRRDQPQCCEEFEQVRHDVFDSNPSYRLAEGLRDYVQHYASRSPSSGGRIGNPTGRSNGSPGSACTSSRCWNGAGSKLRYAVI